VSSVAWILRGRCHPEETVSFNALDGALDDLAATFQHFEQSPLASLTTDEANALVRLFPILASSTADAAATDVSSAASRHEIRHRALTALRCVLATISKQRTPLIWLDDLQWGDADSGALLRDLLSTGSGLPLLLVASYRDSDVALGHALEVLQRDPSVLGGGRAQKLSLLPLSEHDSHALLQELVQAAPGQSPSRLAELCKEAAGLPFLLREVASYLHDGGDSTLGAIQVSDMLEHRMSQLCREALDIVEIVSIAGSPIEHRTALEAAGLEASSVPLFVMLERLALLRTTAGAPRATEVYHHRIREHVLLRLDEAKIRERHAAIANALLNEANPNLHRIVEHYERAGAIKALRRYVIPAARQAQDGYAFDRAAVLYKKAIEVGAGDLDQPELYTQLGHALANAGQARAAGESYERATSMLVERPDPERVRILALRRAAAEQYLQSGHDRPAIQALREVLATHDVRMPGTRGEAIALGVVLRVRLLFRQLDVPPRDTADVPAELLERFDVTWAVGVRLAMVNHAQVSYFAARCLDIALETREPSRLALALSWEASALSMLGPLFAARVRHMLTLARRMVEPFGPYERAMVAALTAATEWLAGRFRRALELDDTATELLGRARHEFHWERALFDTWSLSALALLGEYRELSARVRAALDEAERRDDRYLARNCYLGEPTLAWLAQDRPDWALERANQAIAWSPSEYTTQHYHHYLALAFALLYKGDAAAAFTLSLEVWPHLRSNLFLTLATVREELVHLRGSIALALAESTADGSVGHSGQTSATLLRRVRRDAATLRRARTALGTAWSELLMAGVDNLEGRQAACLRRLARAVELLQRCQLAGYEHAARFCLGRLTRGAQGAALEKRSLSWYTSPGVCAPERFIRMLAPGLAR
jgi:tetratricopeptide (TPR) repeat protein